MSTIVSRTTTLILKAPSGQRLPVGIVIPVRLDQMVQGLFGEPDPGPHLVGKAQLADSGDLEVKLFNTNAGRHALAQLTDDLLDVAVVGDPAHLWLGVLP